MFKTKFIQKNANKFAGSKLSQVTKLQSQLSLAIMRRDQLIIENQQKFSFSKLEQC